MSTRPSDAVAVGLCHPATVAECQFKAIIQELVRVVKFVQPDIIAGIPSLGLAFSGAVSLACEIPSIIARGTPEDHGEGTALQGTYSAGQTVLVLDDATGDGTTKRACIDQLLADWADRNGCAGSMAM
jgi:orotate phosphoribosyltransferase